MTTKQPAPSQPRKPNLALRRARQAMLMSQSEFASAIRAAGTAQGLPNGCTKRLVQKWETGEHAGCRADYLIVLQTVTGLSAHELGFSTQEPDTEPEVASPGTENPHVAADSAMDRLRYAVEHPVAVTEATAVLAQAATTRLYDLERHSPARILAPTVHRHLSTVTALLEVAKRHRVRRRLTTTSGESMLLAGWLAFDQGETVQANRFWDSAISVAHSTEDGALLAAAFTQQSYAAARHNDAASAWDLAYTAYTHTSDEPRTRAWILSRIALYTAQLGEHEEARTAYRQAIQTDATFITHPKPGDDARLFTRTLTPAVLHATVAHTAALLNDTAAAAYHASAATKALGPARDRTRALVLAEITLTAAMTGDYDACGEHGIEAANLARTLETSLAADLLHRASTLLVRHCALAPVRDLLPELTRLPRTVIPHEAMQPKAG